MAAQAARAARGAARGFEGRLFVVVPAFNEAPGITATLTALAGQDDQEFELVVVDNDSADGTADVVRAFTGLPAGRVHVIHESQKGTGAAADTGMRAAIGLGGTHLARTDADCLPEPDWVRMVKVAFAEGLDLVSGQLLPRHDEGVTLYQRWVLLGAVELASAVGKIRPGNRDPGYLGPYVMTPGCNMAITSELYVAAGGFPRTKIEDVHEDRALVNEVRRLTTAYALRRNVRVRGSMRRVRAWGLRRTLAWYADHRYKPEVVDIR